MPGKKSSIFSRKPVKKKKKSNDILVRGAPVRKSGSKLPAAITASSSLLHNIQGLLEREFDGAPEIARAHLVRCANEIQDLLKLLVDMLKGTPSIDSEKFDPKVSEQEENNENKENKESKDAGSKDEDKSASASFRTLPDTPTLRELKNYLAEISSGLNIKL